MQHTQRNRLMGIKQARGFTIVELAVVVLVLGILVSLSVFAWNGWRERTAVNVLKSDLSGAAAQLASDLQWKNTYPETAEAANGGKGLPASEGTTYQYTRTAANAYCLTATSATQGVPAMMISSSEKVPKEGVCSDHTDPNGSKGEIWTLHQAAEANKWISVTYGNGLFVAVASDGENQVMTSPDGQNWTAHQAAIQASWKSVTYGNGRFVAVGSRIVASSSNGVVMTSPDGQNWTAHSPSASNVWSSVAYANGRFVAVSATAGGYKRMYSTDGSTWLPGSGSGGTQSQNVVYGNGRFVAGPFGSNSTYSTSDDGISWIARSSPEGSWGNMVFGKGKFIMKGTDGKMAVSSDGENWDIYTATSSNQSFWPWVFSIGYGNGRFVAVSNSGSMAMISSDGLTWEEQQAHSLTRPRVTYGDGCFVAVGEGLRTMRSCQ